MINVPKGTKDVLPSESYKWQFVEKTARDVAALFNVSEIRTPTFEHTEVFLRGVGETTDVVNKEMYTFLDKGGRSITLKPEGTAGVARAFVENGLASSAMPLKTYYVTPCFRYERPQAGRLREFHQFGVEMLGSDRPEIDAEAIVMAKTFLNKLGITGVSLYINSIGCKECRKKYQAALVEYFKQREGELCELCVERLYKNPLRLLDCKNPSCKEIAASAPVILDFLCDDCKAHFNAVQGLLSASGVDFKVDSGIVRGLDYYSRTVFEFVSDCIGAQGTVCGGGRYDGLISTLGGGDIHGIGFAAGIERLLIVMEKSGAVIPEPKKVKVYFAPMGADASVKAFTLAGELRQVGVNAETDVIGRGIKAQFKYADKIGAQYVGVIGADELAGGVVKVKNMESGEENFIAFDEVKDFFVKQL